MTSEADKHRYWIHILAERIEGSEHSVEVLEELIREECPFKPNVAYMPVPRCETCVHLLASPGVLLCAVLELDVTLSFGCVRWRENLVALKARAAGGTDPHEDGEGVRHAVAGDSARPAGADGVGGTSPRAGHVPINADTDRTGEVALGDGPAQWTCKANRTADPPQDCDWPLCGCDPYAEKVVDALHEAGALRSVHDLPTGKQSLPSGDGPALPRYQLDEAAYFKSDGVLFLRPKGSVWVKAEDVDAALARKDAQLVLIDRARGGLKLVAVNIAEDRNGCLAALAAKDRELEQSKQETAQAIADVFMMAQTRVGAKCEHHKLPLAKLEYLAQRECPICWMECAKQLETQLAAQAQEISRLERLRHEQATKDALIIRAEAEVAQIAALRDEMRSAVRLAAQFQVPVIDSEGVQGRSDQLDAALQSPSPLISGTHEEPTK